MRIIDLDQLPSNKLEEIEKILSETDEKQFQIYHTYESFIRRFLDTTKQYDEYGNLIKSLDDEITPIEIDGKIKNFDDDIKYNLNINHESHIDEDIRNLIAVKESGILDMIKKAREIKKDLFEKSSKKIEKTKSKLKTKKIKNK